MSVVSVSVYVYDTYISIDDVARIMYLACAITFSVEYLARLLAADDVLSYLLWDWSLVDLATIVYGVAYYVNLNLGQDLGFIRLLRIIQVVRLCKAITFIVLQYTRRTSQPMQLEYVRRSADLAVTLVAVVFISACVFYELEVVQEDLQLHTAIYWACVTISTIGYGDYAPETVPGQLLFPLIIIIVILILPRKISHLFEVMQNFSRFIRRSHRSHRFGQHVVLTGHVTPLSAQTFISEFYHQGRGYQDMAVVLLCPADPDAPLVITMNNPRWEQRVNYLNGSPFLAEDLARADTGRALAVFVLADKYAADPAAEDSRTLLAVLAVAQYLRQFCCPEDLSPPRVVSWSATSWKGRYPREPQPHPHPHIIAQFLLNETLDHAIALLRSGSRHPPEMGLVPLEVSPFPICVGSLRASLLGAALHTPGLISLVANLAISASLNRRTALGGVEGVETLTSCGWLSEYLRGASVEICDVAFPQPYWGLTFKQAALKLWREEEVILIGVRQANHRDAAQSFDVKLAPMGDWAASPAVAAAAAAEGPLILDEDTVGYILSVDALVLGSGPLDVVNLADDRVMRPSSLYLQHQNQQLHLQQQQQQQQVLHMQQQVAAAAAAAESVDVAAEARLRAVSGDGCVPGPSARGGPSFQTAMSSVGTPLESPLGSTNVPNAAGPFGTAAGAAAAASAAGAGGDCDMGDETLRGRGTSNSNATAGAPHLGINSQSAPVWGGGDHNGLRQSPPPALPPGQEGHQESPADAAAAGVEGTGEAAPATAGLEPEQPALSAGVDGGLGAGGGGKEGGGGGGRYWWRGGETSIQSVPSQPVPQPRGFRPGPEAGPQQPQGLWQTATIHAAWLARRSVLVAKMFPGLSTPSEAAGGRNNCGAAAPATPDRSASGSGGGGGGRGNTGHGVPATSTRLRRGMKATTRVPDLHALAAVSSFTYLRGTQRSSAPPQASGAVTLPPGEGSPPEEEPQTTEESLSPGFGSAASGSECEGGDASEEPPAALRQMSRRRQRQRLWTAAGPSPCLSPPPPPPQLDCRRPRTVDTFAGGPPLDSPVLIIGSSCFVQLRQLVGAIRSAPPVGYSRSFLTRAIVIFDDSADGKALSDNQLAAVAALPGALPDQIFVLRANPLDAADLDKLNLKPHGSVAALMVPSTALFTEEAVVGSVPALADGRMLVAAAALRRHCEEMKCELRVVAEVLALNNCSCALPLCLSEGPYSARPQERELPPGASPDKDGGSVPGSRRDVTVGKGAAFVTDPRPDFRRGVRRTIRRWGADASVGWRLRYRPVSDQARQEQFLQEVLSEMPHLAPALAPGHILMQTFMDALACQSIFNPMVLQILLKMLDCWGLVSGDRWARHHHHHPRGHQETQQEQRAHGLRRNCSSHRLQQTHRAQQHQLSPGADWRPPRHLPSNPAPAASATAASEPQAMPAEPRPGPERISAPASQPGAANGGAAPMPSASGPAGSPVATATPSAVVSATAIIPQPAPARLHAPSEPLWLSPPPPPLTLPGGATARSMRCTGAGRGGGWVEPALPTVRESAVTQLQQLQEDLKKEEGREGEQQLRPRPRGGAGASPGPGANGARRRGPVAEGEEGLEVSLPPPPPVVVAALDGVEGCGPGTRMLQLEASPGMACGPQHRDMTHGSLRTPGAFSPSGAPTRFQPEAAGSSLPGCTTKPMYDRHGGCGVGGVAGSDAVQAPRCSAAAAEGHAAAAAAAAPHLSRGLSSEAADADGGDSSSASGDGSPAAVRLFCLNLGEMLQRFAGLADILDSVQENQQRQQQCSHHHQYRYPRQQQRQQCRPQDDGTRRGGLYVGFGVLFEVLVAEYDMMPLALYRRDAAGDVTGGGAAACGPGRLPAATAVEAAARRAAVSGGCRRGAGRARASSGMPYVAMKPERCGTWLRESDDVYLLSSQAVVLRFWGELP